MAALRKTARAETSRRSWRREALVSVPLAAALTAAAYLGGNAVADKFDLPDSAPKQCTPFTPSSACADQAE
jgi:hypothetical protein